MDRHVDLGDAPGRANAGDKLLTLVASALAGGDCIDDADALRTGGTADAIGCAVSVEMKAALRQYRVKLDPVALLHAIREAQSALAAVTSPEIRPTPSGESLEQFLAKLPDLWRQDAARTSRERRVQPPRTWRTRPDPFEGVSCDVLGWLQEDPDASAVVLLGRLQEAEPDRFSRAHLRTLQRRVQQWRGIMSKELVYATAGEPMAGLPAMPELALVGADPKC